MKKTTKESTAQDELKFDSAILIENLLTKYGAIIHDRNIDNYKQWMKKPFMGWVISAQYDKNTNYELMIVQDCINMKYKEVMDECLEEMRNQNSDKILSDLNKPAQKRRFIAAKKMARK